MDFILTIIRILTAIIAPAAALIFTALALIQLRLAAGNEPEEGQSCLRCDESRVGGEGQFHYAEAVGNARERAASKSLTPQDTPILGSESHFVCDKCARRFIRNEIIQIILLVLPYPLYLYVIIPVFAQNGVFANFLTTLLYRYPGQVHAIEVWNEMNIDREWASVYGLSAERYVQLLQAAYGAIKAVDPGIIVISGALSPTGVNDGVGAYDDFVYMDMLIQAGLLQTTDCVGAHHNGYNIGPNVPWNNVPNDPTATFRGPFDNPHHSWSFYSTLNGYAQRIQQAGSDKKLCITEFGWPVTEDLNGFPVGFEFANDNSLAEQAQYFDEAIQLMQDWGFVWLAFVWNLNYGPQAGWDASNDNVPYSLLRPEWHPAPAYDVISAYDFRGQ